MKSALFFLLIGAVLGVVGWRYYQRAQHPTVGQRVDKLADHARDAARDTKDAVAGKAEELKLTPGDIHEELAKTGQVVRSKARLVGDCIDDARIMTVIKGKYVVDDKLSALAITVDCRDGAVILAGSAPSEESIGRAVTLALETSGVRSVVSQLVVKN